MTIPDTPFGARVRARLRDEQPVWLTDATYAERYDAPVRIRIEKVRGL